VVRAAGDPTHAALIRLAAAAGLRQGELRGLQWRDLNFAARTVHVRRSKSSIYPVTAPKSGKVRSVPLMDHAARALDGLSRREPFTGPEDLVFPSPTGRHLEVGVIRRESPWRSTNSIQRRAKRANASISAGSISYRTWQVIIGLG
jgi:integrase